MSSERLLVVALHDVAPPFERNIRFLLARLAEIGVARCALKVVPNWHGNYPLEECHSLIELLGGQVERGSEIVLHGFSHDPSGPVGGSFTSRLRATLFAPHTAEFLALTPKDAVAKVSQGIDVLTLVGLPHPTTFCAPGWLITPENKSAIARAGIRYMTGMHSLEVLRTGRSTRCLSFGQMGGSPMQEVGVASLNVVVLRVGLARARVAQVYFHPQFEPGSRAVDRVLSSIELLIQRDRWQTVTFEHVLRVC